MKADITPVKITVRQRRRQAQGVKMEEAIEAHKISFISFGLIPLLIHYHPYTVLNLNLKNVFIYLLIR